MERSEGSDDDAVEPGAYPPAPLPPHERTWRHPSEIGTAMWAHTEPPLTLGRGLLVTTGAIGGLLSLAVLWAMLPSVGRGGEAAPTVVTSVTNDLPSPTVATRIDTFVATSVDGWLTSTTLRSTSLNAPSKATTTTTTTAAPPSTVAARPENYVDATPVAVGVGDSLVITTAHAVEGHKVISVIGSDGQPYDANVLMVDAELGLAVLSADTAAVTGSYGIGPTVSAGDVVTVRGAEPTSATVSIDADGHVTLDTWGASMAEGTPVLDADGLLVGMCSRGASGPIFVSVANVAALLPDPKPAQTAPWLGIHVIDGARGALTVDAVDSSGPAAVAGITIGDVITAIDGVVVISVDQLKAAIDGHVPNDVVTLTITHADQTSTDVAVTLGATAPL